MNVLVTGATGFIGTGLCEALSKAGHWTAALSRDPERAQRRIPTLDAAFRWDPKAGPPAAAFTSVEAVIHLAGENLKGRWTQRKRRAIRESRVLGTRRLVDAIEALAKRPRVLLSASASGYYGDRGDEELTEESSTGAGFLAETVGQWEREALRARSLGVRVVALRTGLVLGKGGGALGALLPLFRVGLGGPLGGGRQWWPWVHEGDVVGIILRALAADWDGGVNVSAPEPVRQRDFARALGHALHRPAFLPAPAFALRLVAGEVASELLASRRMLPSRALGAGYSFQFPRLEAALEDLFTKKRLSPLSP